MPFKITAAIIFFTLSAMLGATETWAETKAPAITVTGTGAVAGAPDRAEIRAGVTAERPGADAAMKAASALSENILGAARKHGIAAKDIQTKGISLDPVYDRQNRNQPPAPPRITGYRARLDHKLASADIAGLGKLLDGLTTAGANQIGGIRLYVDDTRAFTDQARRKAMQDARRAAGVLASEAGLALGQVLSISEGAGNGPVPLMMERALTSAAIAPGEVTYNVRVRVTFALKKKQ
ncbi:MAG: SIMPL domain-containing protein [Rhodospirillales bacterium]|nr:SIMPL domain-containing protein [Rhodospirillales bacterium]